MDFDSQNCQAIENKYNKNIPVQEWKKKNRVLIMQHSAVTNFNDRQQNRETWMQVLQVNRIINKFAFVLDFCLNLTSTIIILICAFRIIHTYEQYSLLEDLLKMNMKLKKN